MRIRIAALSIILLLGFRAFSQQGPVADHHQHLGSPEIVKLAATSTRPPVPISAKDVVALLDASGIQRALVFSAAYVYGSPVRTVEDEYAKVRAENDWTGAQAALYPKRLRAFCSFNPLKDYALAELERCAKNPNLKGGLKLHFSNSDVQLDNPAHVEQLARIFSAANKHRMAIVIHLRPSISRQRPYGAAQAQVFLEKLLPLVPKIDIQIAHLAGNGAGYDSAVADKAMAVLAEAIEKNDPRTRRLWFDFATTVTPNISPADAALIVKRIRQVGAKRVLYGSDAQAPPNLTPRDWWAAFRKLPLTESEFNQIARNVAPYLR